MLTVTTPAESYDLTTVEAVRVALGIEGTDQDDQLAALVTAASGVIAKHCRRVLAVETVAQTFRIVDHPNSELILSRYPVTAVESVTENGITLEADQFEVNPDNGVLTRLYGDRPAWWPIGKIIVTYSAGFNVPAETPAALKQAALRLVQSYYLGADRDPMIRSESVDNLSSTAFFGAAKAEHLPPEVLGILAGFRDMRV